MNYFVTHVEPTWSDPSITLLDNLDRTIEMFRNTDVLGADTENNGLNVIYSHPLLSQFSNGKDSFVIDDRVGLEWLKQFTDKTYLTFNGQYDYMIWKWHFQIELRRMIDLMLNEQVIRRGIIGSNNLEVTHQRRLNEYLPLPKATRNSFGKMKLNPVYEFDHISYAAYDPYCLFRIFEAQKPLIEEHKLQKRIYEIAQPLIPILGDMCLEGFHLNEELWRETLTNNKIEKYHIECKLDDIVREFSKDYIELRGGKWTRKRKKTVGEQVGLFGDTISVENNHDHNISYSSSKQLVQLFNILREPIPQKRDPKTYEWKNSFAEEALEQYKIEYPGTRMKRFINLLLEYREYEKEINSFGEIFLKDRVKDGKSKTKFKRGYKNSITGKVHTIYKQEVTANGRLASGDGRKKKDSPGLGLYNSQQVPKKNKFRNAFTLTQQEIDDGWFLDTDDLAGAELVILASHSQDKKLLELLSGDIHSGLATPAYTKIIQYILDNMNEKRAYDEIYELLKVNRLQEDYYIKLDDGTQRVPNQGEIDQITRERVNYAINNRAFVVDKKKTPDIRNPFKNNTYGIAYGATEQKIAETLNIAPFYAELVISAMRNTIPQAFAFLDRVARFGVKYGYIVFNERTNSRHWFDSWIKATMSGRELNRSQKSEIERFCKNVIMSGTQADMIKEGMVEVDKMLRESFIPQTIRGKEVTNFNDKFRWKLQVHDELVFMHRHNSIEEAREYSKKITTKISEVCNLYLKGEVKMGIAGDTGYYWHKD